MRSVLSMLHAHVVNVLMTESWQQSLCWGGGHYPELALVSQCCKKGLGMALLIDPSSDHMRCQRSGTETY